MTSRVTLLVLMMGCEELIVPLAGAPVATPTTPATTSPTTSTATGPTFVDAYTHVDPSIDVLAVVDASCSMANDVESVQAVADELAGELLSLDYDFHAGATTSGLFKEDPGILQPDSTGGLWVDPLTPSARVRFVEQASPGWAGTPEELGFDNAVEALTTQAALANAGFRRTDAQLAVVVFADEDDQSALSVKDVEAALDAQGTYTGDVTFSRITGCKGFPHPRYESVAAATGGVSTTLCDIDPVAFVTDLVSRWWTSDAFVLSSTPDPKTLEVWVDDGKGFALLDSDCWLYDPAHDTVRMTGCFLGAGTLLEVRYD